MLQNQKAKGGLKNQTKVSPAVLAARQELRDLKVQGWEIVSFGNREVPTCNGLIISFIEYNLVKKGETDRIVKEPLGIKEAPKTVKADSGKKETTSGLTAEQKKKAHKAHLKAKSQQASNQQAGGEKVNKGGKNTTGKKTSKYN